MFDASSLLGGMLSGGFGRRRSSGSGVLGTVATVGGIAAVGGLGYMAYKHFTAQPGAQAGPPGWGPPGAAPGAAPGWGGGAPGAMGPGGMGPGGPGAPPGVGGWGAPPGAPGAQGAGPGGIGGFVQGLVGSSTGMQQGAFGGPGYEYQSGGANQAQAQPQYPPFGPPGGPPGTSPGAPAAAVPQYPPFAPPPGMGAPGAAPGAPAAVAAAPAAPEAGQAYAPTGAVPIPPPPVFDPMTGQAMAAPMAAPAAPAAAVVSAPAAAPVDPMPNPDAATQQSALLLVRAMVAAANADGVIDATERQEIMGRLASTGVGAEETAALAAELDKPRPVASLIAEVSTPEMAQQFYAVSLLAISVDNVAEKLHLKSLPGMLGLSPEQVAKIHAELGVPTV